jgi:hypothetical protein
MHNASSQHFAIQYGRPIFKQPMRIVPVVLGLVLSAGAAWAQQEIQVSGAAGWGGRAHRGEPAPVLLDLDNRGKRDAELTIAVTWANNFSAQAQENPSLDTVFGRIGPVHQLSLTLPAKSRKRISLTLLTPDSSQISVWAFALDAKSGRTLARGELGARLLDANKRIVGVVGLSRPEGIEDGSVELANIQPDELPEDWQGYAALEALVWMDGRANEIRSAAQVDALKQWISTGGRFCVARANTVDLGGTPVADLLPVKLGATRELASLGGGQLPDLGAVVLESTVRKGAIRAQSEGVPLVVEMNREAGRVTFAAFDPSRAPFTGWAGTKPFWRWLLDIGRAPPLQKQNEEHAPAAIGSRLLAEQARRFPDVAAPEIGGLFLLIILYLIVVGPLDYLLLRMLKRLEFTWFTFPGYVLLFTLFILLVGGAFIQRAAHQREIAVVDHYPESGFVRSRALSAVLAPADVLYQVEDAQPLSSNFIQNERAGDSGSKTSDVRMLRTPRLNAENWLLNRNFTGLAMADRCASGPSPLSYAITSPPKQEIQVSVKNATGEILQNCVLVTRDGIYEILSIPPGDTTVAGSRLALTTEDFAKREGRVAVQPGGVQVDQENGAAGIKEQELNPQVRKALIGVSFPGTEGEPEPLTGFARGLDANRWVRSGGSILLAWPLKTEAVVRFDPKPGRYTGVTLYRFFQGPPP